MTFCPELVRLADTVPGIQTTTGKGCLRAIQLAGADGTPLDPTMVPAVVAAIRAAGAIVHPGPSCVQLLPALVYSNGELDELLACVAAG